MIIQYEDSYANKIQALLKDYPLPWGADAETTVISLQDGEVIAVGSLSKNAFHPNRDYLHVYVQSEMRRNGIGTALFQELMSSSETQKLQASTSSKDEGAVAFLESLGFRLARKCYTPILRKNSLTIIPMNEDIISFEALTDQQRLELLELQLDNYRQFHHLINPLSDTISFDRWKKIVLEDLDVENSWIFMKNDRIEAYILCYKGEEEGSLAIGYVGGKDVQKLEDYLSFYKNITDKLIQTFKTVEIEADDVDPFAFGLLNCFAYDKSDSWDAYIL